MGGYSYFSSLSRGVLISSYFSKSHLVASTEKRPRIFQQRLDFLGYNVDKIPADLLLLFLCVLQQRLEREAARLGEPRVDEVADAGACQCPLGRDGEQGRGVLVGEELRNDARLGDDFAVKVYARDKAPLRGEKY